MHRVGDYDAPAYALILNKYHAHKARENCDEGCYLDLPEFPSSLGEILQFIEKPDPVAIKTEEI